MDRVAEDIDARADAFSIAAASRALKRSEW